VHHFEWCTKYSYQILKKDEYKKFCDGALRETAQRHKISIRELFVMPEHVHMSAELPPNMSQSKALQLMKGNLSYKFFRFDPNSRLGIINDTFLVHEHASIAQDTLQWM
jgi:putative transposase